MRTLAPKYVSMFLDDAVRMEPEACVSYRRRNHATGNIPSVLHKATTAKPSARPKLSMSFATGKAMVADTMLAMMVRIGRSECDLKADVA